MVWSDTGLSGLSGMGSAPFGASYTSPGTYTPNLPAGTYRVTVQGGGGSGQVGGNRGGGLGGGSGEVIAFTVAWIGGSVSIVVGAGGAAVASVGTGTTSAVFGKDGSASSFTAGSVVATANGGSGQAGAGGTGGTQPTGGNVSNVTDTSGNAGQRYTHAGDSVLVPNSGGLCGNGLYAPGFAGTAPGAGGGGTGTTDGTTVTTSGAGVAGSVTVAYQGPLPAAPTNSVLPGITGTNQQGATLTVSNGVWTGSPFSYSYQWQSNGSNVGTNQNTYVPVSGDVGHTITCIVGGTNAGGTTYATSPATGTITASGPTVKNTPVTTTASTTINLPANATGDTIVIFIKNSTTAGTITGYTRVTYAYYDIGNGPYPVAVYVKISVGDTTATSNTVTDAIAVVVGGTHTVDKSATAAPDTASTSVVAASVTTTAANDLLMVCYVTEASGVTVPAGETQITGAGTLGAAHWSLGYETVASVGATGARTGTATTSAIWAAITVAMK